MSSLAELSVGDLMMVHGTQGDYRRATVAVVGRVWLTDHQGNKFRIADGRGETRNQYGRGFYALTVAEWQVIDETRRLRDKLLSWGWVPSSHGRSLTLDQMRRAAALLAEFEAESAEGPS